MVLDLKWSMADRKKFSSSGSCRSTMMSRSVQTRLLTAPGLAGRGFNKGVKIDNLVQIAHNVVIGKNSIIVAQTGISGSTRVGERVMMGGQVGIVGHIEIADGSMIAAQSGVSKSIQGGVWFGYPAVPLREAKQQIAWIHRLGKLFARVKEIEKKLGL